MLAIKGKRYITYQEITSPIDSSVGGTKDIPFLMGVMSVSYRHPGLDILRLGDGIKGKLDTGRF